MGGTARCMAPMVLAAFAFVGGLAVGSSLAAWIAIAIGAVLILGSRGASASAWATAVALAFFGAGALRAAPPPRAAGWALVEGRVDRVLPGAEGRTRVGLVEVSSAAWPRSAGFQRSADLWLSGRGALARCAQPGSRIRALVGLEPASSSISPWWRPRRRARALAGGRACVAVRPPRRPEGRAAGRAGRALSRLPATPGRAVVRALATGDRSGVSADLREAFADAGFGHLLAISGLHLAMVGGAAGAVARAGARRWSRALESLGEERVGAVVAAGAAVGFAWAVGAPPSASRAAALLVLHAVARVLRRASDPASTLATAVVVLLAWVPSWLHHIGFALSVSAVAALLVFGPRPGGGSRLGRALQSSVAVSFVATVGTAPWLLAAFGRVSIVGLVSNVVAVPFASFVVLPLSLVAAAVAFVDADLAVLVARWAVWSADMLAAFATRVADLPGSAVTLGSHWAAPAAVVVTALLVARSSRALALGLAGAAVAWGLAATPGPSVTFIPVGHGDAALVRTDDGRFVLVDTGTARAFDAVVTTALRRAGVRRLDVLVASHADADHAGGLASAERRFAPQRVLGAGGGRFPEQLKLGGARFFRLGPSAALQRATSDNDRSLVFRLELGGCTVLFTGDVERLAERDLVERAGGQLRADVLKVPHHGSDTSSTHALLAAVRPELAVVSVGPNPHGLPSAAALDRLRRAGARVVRTDIHGPVRLGCDAPRERDWRTAFD